MKFSHILIVLLVVAIWGVNFVAIKIATESVPPIFLAGIRMLLTGIPLIFFVPKPKTSWKWIAAYGLSIFSLNFGFLFAGMKMGMSAGLTSLVFQTQVFFTIGLSVIFFGEKVRAVQILCALLAFVGLIIIGVYRGGNVTLLGFTFVLLACLSWAIGNIVSKKIGKVNLLGLVAWGGFISSLPLFVFSFYIEGLSAYESLLISPSMKILFCVAFLVYPTTILCFSLWSWLLNLYAAPTLLPFTLLVPVFGIFAGAAILNESLDIHQAAGAVLVFLGIGLNLLSTSNRAIVVFSKGGP